MAKGKDILMGGLTEALHRFLLGILDALEPYRSAERFRTEIWQPTSTLHAILGRFGRFTVRSKNMAETLPAVTDLNVVSTAIDGLAQDEALPVSPERVI